MNYLKTPWTSQPQGLIPACTVDLFTPFGASGLPWTTSGSPNRQILGGLVGVSGAYHYRSRPMTGGLTVVIVFTPTSVTGDEGLWSIGGTSLVTDGSPQILLQRSGTSIRVYCSGGYQLDFANACALNKSVTMVLSIDNLAATGSKLSLAVNGVVRTYSGGIRATGESTEFLCTGYPAAATGAISLYAGINKASVDSEIQSLSQNPWQILKPLPRRIFVPVSAVSDILATLNVTEGVETLTASGTVSGAAGVDGTASLTESAETLTASGGVAVGATLSQTEAAETLAASGGVTVGASLSQTESPETASSSGTVAVGGTLSQTEAAETLSASGTVVSGVVGTASINEAAETLSAAGALAIGGSASITNGAQTVTASGDIQITGAGNLIELAETLTASGIALGGITGSANLTLAAQTLSAFGTSSFPTIARPNADTSNSGWTPSTGSDLYAMLDEVTPNDADYISTTSAGSVCRLGLGAVADPGTSSGQVVSYRASSSTGNGLKVELMQGGTVIATWNHATLPATDTTYQQSLSAAECDAITDYTALSVRLTSL